MKLNDFITMINNNLNTLNASSEMYDLLQALTNLVEKLSDGKLTVSAPDNKCTYAYLKSVEYNEIIASFDIKKKKGETKNIYYLYYSTEYTIKAVVLSKDIDGDETIESLLQGAKIECEKRNNAKKERENALIDFLKNYDFSNIETLEDVYDFKKELINKHGQVFNRLNKYMFND